MTVKVCKDPCFAEGKKLVHERSVCDHHTHAIKVGVRARISLLAALEPTCCK
jgi:hypothetical protein